MDFHWESHWDCQLGGCLVLSWGCCWVHHSGCPLGLGWVQSLDGSLGLHWVLQWDWQHLDQHLGWSWDCHWVIRWGWSWGKN